MNLGQQLTFQANESDRSPPHFHTRIITSSQYHLVIVCTAIGGILQHHSGASGRGGHFVSQPESTFSNGCDFLPRATTPGASQPQRRNLVPAKSCCCGCTCTPWSPAFLHSHPCSFHTKQLPSTERDTISACLLGWKWTPSMSPCSSSRSFVPNPCYSSFPGLGVL